MYPFSFLKLFRGHLQTENIFLLYVDIIKNKNRRNSTAKGVYIHVFALR